MKILPITNHYLEQYGQSIVSLKGKNNYLRVNKSNEADSVSFRGKYIFLSGSLEQINNNSFPDDLYLNLDEVFKTFENEDRTYHRWERFPYVLSNLLAKRCNYLGLTKSAEGSSHGSSPEPSYGYPRTEHICISEYNNKNEINRSIEFNWTREYHELQDFFKGIPGKNFGAEDDMQKIRKGLPEILRKQGWIK